MFSNLFERLFYIAILALILSSLPYARVYSQNVVLDRMPVSEVNQPEVDLFDVRRPALSIVGFDNTEPGYNSDHGFGLKQILDRRYNRNEPLVADVFDRLIELAHEEQVDPYTFPSIVDRRIQLDENTNILQARAFEALVTFVLELNGYGPGDLPGPGLRSHGEAMASFKEALVQPAGGVLIVGDDLIDDFVKWGRSIGNVARAIDLYLALENAYVQFASEVDLSLLLSIDQRVGMYEQYATALIGVDMLLTTPAVALYQSEIDLPPEMIELILMLLEHRPEGDRIVAEVEPGNWALKQRTAIGYGALVMQAIPGSSEEALLKALFPASMHSLDMTGSELEGERLKHWNFMTYGGKRFWAESTYYLDWTIEQVVPFFHAVRANGLLGGEPDPFFNTVFTNPLHWLADTVTPDGRFMPLDDGNKSPVRFCGLMRWRGSYGQGELGRKCAWIEQTLDGPARRDEVLLVEISIPRTSTTQAPPSRVGNDEGPLVSHVSEQQLVLREEMHEKTHYVVVNGEHGKAVERGEGHEQPDQLQLLYYVDDLSYLMDSGYDRAETVENSSWNHYYDHNVLTAGIGEGGLRPPELRILEVRKVSKPRLVGEVDALYVNDHGNVTVLHGQQVLNVYPKALKATYSRDVVFVKGSTPYLIDFNRIEHQAEPIRCDNNRFAMNYHVNSDEAYVSSSSGNDTGIIRWTSMRDRAGTSLTIYPMSIEFDAQSPSGNYIKLVPDVALERQTVVKEQADIKRLTISDPGRCQPYWGIASVIQANVIQSEPPTLLWDYDRSMKKQGWIWPQGNNVFDVFIARSLAAPNAGIKVNPSRLDTGYPDVLLELGRGVEYGFARIKYESGKWVIDPQYNLSIKMTPKSKMATLADDDWNATGIAEQNTFEVSQPYPNPSNPTTSIQFVLPENSSVKLSVYDLLGREVNTLIEGNMNAGRHTLRVDGEGLPSGIYLIQVESDFGTRIHKWTLVK